MNLTGAQAQKEQWQPRPQQELFAFLLRLALPLFRLSVACCCGKLPAAAVFTVDHPKHTADASYTLHAHLGLSCFDRPTSNKQPSQPH